MDTFDGNIVRKHHSQEGPSCPAHWKSSFGLIHDTNLVLIKTVGWSTILRTTPKSLCENPIVSFIFDSTASISGVQAFL